MNFHPADRLRGRDARLADGLVYLAHAIIMRRVLAPRCEVGGFIPLHSRHLERILGTRNWPRVKRAALELGLIDCDEKYIVGERSKGYRLREPYASAKWELRPIEDPRLAKRLEAWRASDRRRVWEMLKAGRLPVPLESVAHLHRNLPRIRIDTTIDEPLTSETKLAVDLIRRGTWRFTVDDFGRVHTNIVNLKKTLRPHLSVDGRRLVNLDVANSQPLFLGILLSNGRQPKRQAGAEGEAGGEGGRRQREGSQGSRTLCPVVSDKLGNLREYLAVCQRGELYAKIAARLPGDLEYDVLKQRVLATLYDRDSHRNKVYAALEASFPGFMAALREIKRGDFRRAAHLGQRTESDFIIGRCVGRLAREHPGLFITTIHDSIMTTAGDEAVVQGIMLDEFARLGVQPTVRFER